MQFQSIRVNPTHITITQARTLHSTGVFGVFNNKLNEFQYPILVLLWQSIGKHPFLSIFSTYSSKQKHYKRIILFLFELNELFLEIYF